MHAFTTLPINSLTGTIGRRPSGAPLYHRNSQFGPPERRKLDRNMRVRLLHLAIGLDRRTRQKGQHGGMLKRTGIEVLRQLLFTFLNMQTGACFPSHQQIAQAAGCCVETVRKAIRAFEAAGIIETIRRKVVATFTSRQHRARYDVAVQDSNSYVFNVPLPDRLAEGDLTSPLFRPSSEADTRNRDETNQDIKTTLPSDLAAALAEIGRLIKEREPARKDACQQTPPQRQAMSTVEPKDHRRSHPSPAAQALLHSAALIDGRIRKLYSDRELTVDEFEHALTQIEAENGIQPPNLPH